MIRALLIANRGEIACRIARTASNMGLRTIAVYSDSDQFSLHVEACDYAVHIGGSAASESYLKIDTIIKAALDTGSDAIHPGYGFLSENAAFAKACAEAGIIFVGPSISAIESMGSKAFSKEIMSDAQIPLVPGYHGPNQDEEYLKERADEIGLPVLIKASAGGGGRGMRVVNLLEDMKESIISAKREAKAAFSDDRLLIEKLIQRPRHVEVQVFGDGFGNVVHLFERDCSVQRRHQKVIEEAPAPKIDPKTREQLLAAAVAVARAINYVGAGTVEFIIDENAFYFIEMNTRLQVEHSVTELITGIDLVEWQIRIANGEPMPLQQHEIIESGHAFEARLYAEDPNDFRPQVGVISHFKLPNNGVRIDTGVRTGDFVSVHYDPMIAKLTVHGSDRDTALDSLIAALRNTEIAGLVSNQPFLKRLTEHPVFRESNLHTGFIEEYAKDLMLESTPLSQTLLAVFSIAVLNKRQRINNKSNFFGLKDECSPWRSTNGWRLNSTNHHQIYFLENTIYHKILISQTCNSYEFTNLIQELKITASIEWHDDNYCTLNQSNKMIESKINVFFEDEKVTFFLDEGAKTITWMDTLILLNEDISLDNRLTAPMPGKIIVVEKKNGDHVHRGQTLIVIEAMKMEHSIVAPADGVLTKIHFCTGDIVDEGVKLVDFEVDVKE
jgi:3-methylcrotonyl-CoA carboxylase alpha subunit